MKPRGKRVVKKRAPRKTPAPPEPEAPPPARCWCEGHAPGCRRVEDRNRHLEVIKDRAERARDRTRRGVPG